MRCEKFELMASAYLDEELNANEAKEYHSHLVNCSSCFQYLEEIEQTSLLFKRTPSSEVPRELHSYVMTAIERRVAGDISLQQRTVEWLLTLNPRPFSFATGAVVSILLFAITLSGFRPIPVDTSKLMTPPTSTILLSVERITSSDNEFNAYNGIAANASTNDADYYKIPQVDNTPAWVSLSHLAYQKPGDEGMTALLEVEADGSARLVRVIDDPKDPMVVEQLWWTLHNRTFQPAMVEGQPVATRIVIFMEKMDVGG
jgi:Putative zinc-finger